LVLFVPESLELVIEQAVGIFQGNVLGCAAPWRHVCRVLHRECKLALQT
jgi:hypothetical protein